MAPPKTCPICKTRRLDRQVGPQTPNSALPNCQMVTYRCEQGHVFVVAEHTQPGPLGQTA
jgi:hypothetical protein